MGSETGPISTSINKINLYIKGLIMNNVNVIENTDTGNLPATTNENGFKLSVLAGNNFGALTYTATMSMYDFKLHSKVPNSGSRTKEEISQRELDSKHARNLALYVLKGVVRATVNRLKSQEEVPQELVEVQRTLGNQPYMALQPFVVNIQRTDMERIEMPTTAFREKTESELHKITLPENCFLWVSDGQHRRKAIDMVFEFLDEACENQKYKPRSRSLYPHDCNTEVSDTMQNVWKMCRTAAKEVCNITVEIHAGLDVEQERQLFTDLNMYSKKVKKDRALSFDNSNPINLFMKNELIDNNELKVCEDNEETWDNDTGAISRKNTATICGLLFMNKPNINGALPSKVASQVAEARRFWDAVAAVDGFGDEEARSKTVIAQPVVLKAIAKLFYQYAFSKKKNLDMLEKLLSGIGKIDFSHQNPIWSFYELTDDEKAEHQNVIGELAEYLPNDPAGKVHNIGAYNRTDQIMKFGGRHNDIAPIVSDMIRYQCGLPSRQQN